MSERYAADNLLDFAESLCLAGGMGQGQTSAVAQILLEGDLLGHNTHGLQLLAPYLNCLLYTSPSPRDATLSRMPSSA